MIVGHQTSTVDLCKLCGLQLNSSLQRAYHNVSVAHLKKLRAHLMQFGLVGYCFACNEELSTPEKINAHVQKQGHKQKVITGIRSTGLSNAKLVCDPCCLQFNEVVGWELHLITCVHKEEGVTLNFPSLGSLIQQLSGSSLDVVSPKFELFCSLCEKKFESFDEFVIHLMSTKHIQYLRMSSCYACNKKFLHITDLEKHLFTSKHQTSVQSHNKYLNRRNGDVIQLKQGYSCQPCMIWCQSWQCFTLHLMDDRHRFFSSVSKNLSRLKGKSYPELSPEYNREWMRWKEQPNNLSAWCYCCSKVLMNPEETEIHLVEHCNQKGAEMQNFIGTVATSNVETTEILVCSSCSVGFRSSFALTAHEAFQQHSFRIAASRNSKILGLTFGLAEKFNGNQKNTSEKDPEISILERPLFQNADFLAERFCEGGSPISHNVRSLDLDASESSIVRTKSNSNNIQFEGSREQESSQSAKSLMLNGPKLFTSELVSKSIILRTEEESCLQKDVSSQKEGEFVEVLDGTKADQPFSPLQINHEHFSVSSVQNCTRFSSKNSVCSGIPLRSSAHAFVCNIGNSAGDSILEEKDRKLKISSKDVGHCEGSKPEVSAPSFEQSSRHDIAEPFTDIAWEHRVIVDTYPECSNKENKNLSKTRLNACAGGDHHNAAAACKAENCQSQARTSVAEFPVVAAAVMSPSQSLEASLESAMKVLLSTLTASVAAISESTTLLPEKKRQRESDFVEEEIKRSKVDVLRDAVVQGLSSWHSNEKFFGNSSNAAIHCENCLQTNRTSETERRMHTRLVGDGTTTTSLGGKAANINQDRIDNSGNGTSCVITSGQLQGISMVVAAAVFQPSNDTGGVHRCENGSNATNQLCSPDPGNLLVGDSQGENSSQEINAAQTHLVGPMDLSKPPPLTTELHNYPPAHPEGNDHASSPGTNFFPDAVIGLDSDDESDSFGALQARFFSELQ